MLYDYNYYKLHPHKIKSVGEQRYVDSLKNNRWKCDLCSRTYGQKRTLNEHRKKKHPIS